MNPVIAIDIDIEKENIVNETICTCNMSSSSTKKVGACICTDCKCHLRDIEIIILPDKIQYIGYGVIITTVCFVGMYMLLN